MSMGHGANNALLKTFEKKTKLSLELAYHGDDEGDCYDDVRGFFWCVGGVWTRTAAGKKFAKAVERKLYVTFG